MHRLWTELVGRGQGARKRPAGFSCALVIAWALALPGAGSAQAGPTDDSRSDSGGASSAMVASAAHASAWQSAARNQRPWLQAMYGPAAGDAWSALAPMSPRRSAGASRSTLTPHAEASALPDTNAPLLEFAAKLLGRPYRFGADSGGAYDCSGFVRRVFAEFGLDLPHSSREQFTLGHAVARDTLQAGDLVFFRSTRGGGISHVGLYAGDGLFVHAARHAGRVRVDALSAPYYAARYAGARRLPLECSLVSAQC
jgi:cell wall-associated NlpC family hydrolase